MILRVFLFSLFASPNLSYAQSACQPLFAKSSSSYVQVLDAKLVDKMAKQEIVWTASRRTKVPVVYESEHLNDILSSWNLEKSTPAKIERLAQKLVLKEEQAESLFKRLRNSITKEHAVKDLVRIRVHTLLLKNELLRILSDSGFLNQNGVLGRYREFRLKYHNLITTAKFIGINAASIKYLGVPLYFPIFGTFNLVKNIEFKAEELALVQQKGFDAAYKTISEAYKARLYSQRGLAHTPQAFVLSIGMMVSYNYLRIKNVETRYDVTVENPIPQSHVLFEAWKQSFIEKNNREPNLKNAQDRREWDLLVNSVYRAWADIYHTENGRYPDLAKEKDRLAWEQFLETIVE